MAEPELVEDFFGVYLLLCLNPRYKGRTYIGYTRDPKRRITQHNRGSSAGGAHKTSNRGPWKMVMIVHGFPNNISALRFEWAWQNPNKTIRLQHLNLKKIPRKETVYKFKLRVLSEMLRVGPWCRLPLIIRWLETEYFEEFPLITLTAEVKTHAFALYRTVILRMEFMRLVCVAAFRLYKEKHKTERKPPDHMSVAFGPVKSRNLKKKPIDPTPSFTECLLCSAYITNTQIKLTCLNPKCELECHITCLADIFLSPGEYIPVEGTCPFCNTKLKWGDLIRKMRGCKMGDVADTNSDKKDKSIESMIEDEITEISDEDERSESDGNDEEGDDSDENSDGSDDVLRVLEKANERRPSWLFEDI